MARLVERLARRMGFVPAKRAFEAAKVGRLFSDWVFAATSADAELAPSLRQLRSRSRDLSINNPYVRRFFRLVRKNVVGPAGIKLVMRAVRDDFRTPDEDASRRVQEGFRRWGRRGTCTVDGRFDWVELQNQIVMHWVRDGEVLIRLVEGFDNPFGFAVQPIEADHLDESYSVNEPGRNEIRMGVELDRWKRPVAYHLLTGHPGDAGFIRTPSARERVRVPADEIVHLYRPDRFSQTRGYPETVAVMTRLKMLGGYEDAALVAARAGAAKMGFLEETEPDAYGPEGHERDDAGNVIAETEPGIIERLPRGVTFKAFDPGYPDGDLDPFLKALLRGVASGLNVSYHTLAGDLGGVNYSSGRLGLLDDRDEWRSVQGFVIEHALAPIFERWLRNALLTGAVNLPFRMLPRLVPTWRSRGWDWVDPQKEETANGLAIANGLKSRTDILAQQGKDFDEVIEDLAAENEKAAALGVTLATAGDAAPAAAGADDDNEGGDDA